VAARNLQHVLGDCRTTLRECRVFAANAHAWSLPGAAPHISRRERDWISELAFLRAFLALESFLEETFVLYSLGRTAPKGRAPYRLTFPPNRDAAEEWVVPEGRSYASWAAHHVSNRAGRFFRDGRPFATILRQNQNALDEARTIRNAIAHDSSDAHEKFENLVRNKLGVLPPHLSVGSFLITLVPLAAPPRSFLDEFIDRVELIADKIVPSR
jgi:hypothetical protein